MLLWFFPIFVLTQWVRVSAVTTSDSVWISFCLTLFFCWRKCPCVSRIFTFIGFRKSQGWVMEPGKGIITICQIFFFFHLFFAFIFFVNLHLYPSLHGDASWFPGLVPSFHSPPDRRMFAVRPRFLYSVYLFIYFYIPLTKLPSTCRFFIFIFPFILKNIFNNSFRENWWLSFNAWRWRSHEAGLIDSLFTFFIFKINFLSHFLSPCHAPPFVKITKTPFHLRALSSFQKLSSLSESTLNSIRP